MSQTIFVTTATMKSLATLTPSPMPKCSCQHEDQPIPIKVRPYQHMLKYSLQKRHSTFWNKHAHIPNRNASASSFFDGILPFSLLSDIVLLHSEHRKKHCLLSSGIYFEHQPTKQRWKSLEPCQWCV